MSKASTLDLHPKWEFVSDQVMGGVSNGQLLIEEDHTRLQGAVSLDNNGGFVQMAFDLAKEGAAYDASLWDGLEVDLLGNGERYELRLRTTGLARPWQSFRMAFDTTGTWQTMRFPFDRFEAHRTEVAFDPRNIRRIGILAIGRAFDADIAVGAIRFYREPGQGTSEKG